MRVCVVGSGGREHALAHVLAAGSEVEVVACPGNAGISAEGIECTVRPPEAVEADLYVIGPEKPLVDGLADALRAKGRLVLGPGAGGARLEGSKSWMKDAMVAAGVPTAAHASFSEIGPALAYLRRQSAPFVIKTDGLAGGKGVTVSWSREEAEADVVAKMSGAAFGRSGTHIVIEEGLSGPELSLLVLCDGHRFVPLPPARDHKRVGDGDTGPMTGGMGAYSPVPDAGPDTVSTIMERVVEPTLAELSRRGIDYRGVLFAGLMMTETGPKLLEHNVRFGDPESQVVLPRLAHQGAAFAELLRQAAAGRIESDADFVADAVVTVALASKGYPGDVRTGEEIEGTEEAAAVPGVKLFHAATSAGQGRRLLTAGGRVLWVTAIAPTLAEARDRAYRAAEMVRWPGAFYRTDIAGEDAR